ncbi:hypothetical protein Btru_068194 [Bulinus truncatus]|nr:hypothetical protein Btru_068194 [Bulinus truncatus]
MSSRLKLQFLSYRAISKFPADVLIMMTPGNYLLGESCVNLTEDQHEVHVNCADNELSILKQELQKYQLQNKKLSDQLNCLLSLIKRSWAGDRLATVHLSNIVGLNPTYSESQNGNIARANSADVTFIKNRRCEQNWERLAFKLLEREYLSVQKELRQHQQHYLENRQLYMDAVLNDHQSKMSRLPLHHSNKEKKSSERVKGLRRTQSAHNRKPKTAQDLVEKNNFSLHDLFGDPGVTDKSHSLQDQVDHEPNTTTPSKYLPRRLQSATHLKRLPLNTYNDVSRYAQTNLFELNENDIVRKPRPVSASNLIHGDIQRSKPKMNRGNSSDCHLEDKVFITQNNERSIKYETTRPVTAKSKVGKQRRSSHSDIPKACGESTTNLISASAVKVSNQNVDNSEQCQNTSESNNQPYDIESDNHLPSSSSERVEAKPPIGSRIKSGFVRRPKCIDEFSEDEQKMKNIAEEFKKNTVLLQKKLGLCESGFIKFD